MKIEKEIKNGEIDCISSINPKNIYFQTKIENRCLNKICRNK